MKNITGLPEYINFHYQFDIFSLFTLITILYSIPPTYFLAWMFHFWVQHKNSMTKNGLRSDIFLLFLVMQLVCTLNTFNFILFYRLPLTGVFTSYCASKNPKTLIYLCYLFMYFTVILRNLSTLLFCFARSFMMFSKKVDLRMYFKEIFGVLSILIAISVILSLIRNSDPSICVQLEPPYPFGALRIALDVPVGYKSLYSKIEHIMYPTIMVILLVSTGMTFWKLHQLRKQSEALTTSTVTYSRKKPDLKSEKTLTVAMTLILLPILLTEVIVICESLGSHFYVLVLVRSVFGDARAHVVTCYFYWTHPIFECAKRRKRTCVKGVVTVT